MRGLGILSIYVNHARLEIPKRYLRFTQLPRFEYITAFWPTNIWVYLHVSFSRERIKLWPRLTPYWVWGNTQRSFPSWATVPGQSSVTQHYRYWSFILIAKSPYVSLPALTPDGHFKIPHLWPPQNPPPMNQNLAMDDREAPEGTILFSSSSLLSDTKGGGKISGHKWGEIGGRPG